MSERPNSRKTVIVWWCTVALMALIALVILLITTPWADKVPGQHRPKSSHTASTVDS